MNVKEFNTENGVTFASLDLVEAGLNISDNLTRDGVMAYAAVLAATREIFGVKGLTENVMIAAIQAGSDIGWRGIMGPKYKEPTAVRRI